eukprot:3598644-Prymnesium_polylepis.1
MVSSPPLGLATRPLALLEIGIGNATDCGTDPGIAYSRPIYVARRHVINVTCSDQPDTSLRNAVCASPIRCHSCAFAGSGVHTLVADIEIAPRGAAMQSRAREGYHAEIAVE